MAKKFINSADIEVDDAGRIAIVLHDADGRKALIDESGRLKVTIDGITLNADIIDLDVEAITGAGENAKSLYDIKTILDSILVDQQNVNSAANITAGNISIGSASTTALAANPSRKSATFINDSDEVIYLALGATAELNKGIRLNAGGGFFELSKNNLYTGIVTAICASGSKNLCVTEVLKMLNQPITVDNITLNMTAAGTAEVKDGGLSEAKMKHGVIQNIESSGFTIDHQGSNVVWLWLDFGMGMPFESDATTAIVDGLRPGHELFIYIRQNNMGSTVTLKNGANVNLPGDWKTYVAQTGDWIHLRWDYLVGEWVYIASNDGMPADCSGANAHGEGNLTIASGANSHAEGNTTEACGPHTHAEGNCTTASGDSSHAQGVNSIASGYFSHAEGSNSLASHYCEHAHASGGFSVPGDGQGSSMQLTKSLQHSTSDWVAVSLGNLSMDRLVLKLDSTADGLFMGDDIEIDVLWGFECRLIGCTQGLDQCFDFIIKGAIKNDNGVMALLWQNTDAYYRDDTTFEAQVMVDSTNKALEIQVRDTAGGTNNRTVRWSGTLNVQQLQWS